MRGMLKFLGVLVVGFLILVVLTGTVSFIKRAWFGYGAGYTGKRVAVVDLAGMIVSSTSFVEDIKEYADDSSIKAIVVRINSPGGMVAPSQEMYNAIKNADTKKPVLISMGSVAASGGYYAALGGRKIYANPGTLTASIGVIMEFLNLEKLYQWAKVSRFTLTAGEMKDAGSPLKPMTSEEKKMFQAMLTDIHTQFRAAVGERRKIESPTLETITDGRVMTGSQALNAKLIDALGGLEETLAEAKKLGGLPADAAVEFPDKSQSLLRKILLGEEGENSNSLFRGIIESLAPGLAGLGAVRAEGGLPVQLSPGWNVLLKAPVY
jgi:protease IV